MKEQVYINQKFVPAERASISVFDRGLNYGDGLFETMKSCCARIFLLNEHIKRLKSGARALSIPVGQVTAAARAIGKLLELNGLVEDEARVRITLTRGPDRGTHALTSKITPTIIMTAVPIDTRKNEQQQKRGVSAELIPRGGEGAEGGEGGDGGADKDRGAIKTLSFLPNVMGRMRASRSRVFEGIFMDQETKLTEGTSTNLFIVSNNVLSTPALNSAIVPGITRGAVIKLAERAGIEVRQGSIYKRDLESANEAFITNSIIELVPLIKADRRAIGIGAPGPVTQMLQGAYKTAASRGAVLAT